MYFILLVAQLFQQIANLEHKPPITLGLMACKVSMNFNYNYGIFKPATVH